MAIIELGCMIVKPGTNVMDETTEEGRVIIKAWKSVVAAPGGPSWSCWGTETTSEFRKDVGYIGGMFVQILIVFRFGGEAVKDLPLVLERPEFSKHVDVPASLLLRALSSTLTQILLVYFPSNVAATVKQIAVATVEQLTLEVVETGMASCVTHGWGIENDFKVLDANDGSTGSCLMIFFGMTEATDASAQATDRFSKNILHRVEGIIRVVSCQVQFRPAEKRSQLNST